MTKNSRIQRSRFNRALSTYNGIYAKLLKAEEQLMALAWLEGKKRGFDNVWDFIETHADTTFGNHDSPNSYCEALALMASYAGRLCATHDDLVIRPEKVEFGK